MGQLPSSRVEPARPFSRTGVDYCGPIYVKVSNARKSALAKAYIALFICFTTKALHLELVEDMSKDAFISAFRRFISRRGKPVQVFSDNGSNFIAAPKELKEIAHLWDAKAKQNVENSLVNGGIQWSFIPPQAPNFGGLWESGVKLVKYHLKRLLGNSHLTFIQLNSLLIQIEGVINSRPITPLVSSPNELSALTPAHFLVGDLLTTIPETDFKTYEINRLDQWQRTQKLLQHFWQRWHTEYLQELQQRAKWKGHQENIKLGTIVLVKDDNLPPMIWKLGKVEEIYPGADGYVRVVKVRTSNGTYKRSVSKLCPLPFDEIDKSN